MSEKTNGLELVWAGIPEPGVAGFRVPTGLRPAPAARARPAVADGRGARAWGGAAASGSSRGRAGWGQEEEPPHSARSSRAGSASCPRFSCRRWTEPHRPPARAESVLPSPGPAAPVSGRRTPSHAFPGDGRGPAAAPGRCPAAGGGAAPPGTASPGSSLPEALPGTRKRKRRRGQGQASRPRRAGAQPGGSCGGDVGGPCADSRDGGLLAPVSAASRSRPGCARHFLFLHCSTFVLLAQFSCRIAWFVINPGEVRDPRPRQPAGRSASPPPLPGCDSVPVPQSRLLSKFCGKSESPGVLPTVMGNSCEPSHPPGQRGRDPKTTSVGKVTLWSATPLAGILPFYS